MAFDIGFIIGADDSEFRAKLRESEGAANRSLGRLGSLVESRTSGFRKLTGSVSSVTGAMTSMIGAAGAVGIAVTLIAAAWKLVSGDSQQAITAINEYNKKVRDTASFINEARTGVSEFSDGQRRAIDEIEKLREAWSELSNTPGVSGDQLIEALATFTEQKAVLEDILRIEKQRAVEAREAESIGRIASARRDAEVAALRAAGDNIEAMVVAENALNAQRIREIELLKETAERQSILLDAENDRHRAALRDIKNREQAEHEAAANRAAQEQELADKQRQAELRAIEQTRQRTRQETENLEVRRLQLLGRDDEARRLEIQLDLERRIADIRSREGLTGGERTRAIAAARDVARLELGVIEAKRRERDETRTAGLLAGLNVSELLRVQVLGGRSSQTEGSGSRLAKSLDGVKPSLDGLKGGVDSLRRVIENRAIGAVFS